MTLEPTEVWIEVADDAQLTDALSSGIGHAILATMPPPTRAMGARVPVYLRTSGTGARTRATSHPVVHDATRDGLRSVSEASRRGRPAACAARDEVDYLLAGAAGATVVLVDGPAVVRAIAAAAPGRGPRVVARCGTMDDALQAIAAGAEGVCLAWGLVLGTLSPDRAARAAAPPSAPGVDHPPPRPPDEAPTRSGPDDVLLALPRLRALDPEADTRGKLQSTERGDR